MSRLLPVLALALLLAGACGGGSAAEHGTGSERSAAAAPDTSLDRVDLSASRSEDGVLLQWEGGLDADFNVDGRVGPLDLNLLVDNFGSDSEDLSEPDLRRLDANDDGEVGSLDWNRMIEQFNRSITGFLIVRRELDGVFTPPVEDLWNREQMQPAPGGEALEGEGGSTDFTVAYPPPPEDGGPPVWTLLDEDPPDGPVAYTAVPFSADDPPPAYGTPANPVLAESRGTRLQLAGPGREVTAGETFVVRTRVREVPDLFTVNARVSYDSNDLDLLSVVEETTEPGSGDELTNVLPEPRLFVGGRVASGVGGFNAVSQEPDPDPLTGDVAFFRFRAEQAGQTALSFVTETEFVDGEEVFPFLFMRDQAGELIEFSVDSSIVVQINEAGE